MDGVVLNCTEKKLAEKGIIELSQETETSDEYIGRKQELKDIYIPPEELEKMKQSYSHSIVQDFDDMYHMPKKEREKMKETYGKFIELKRSRKKVRQLNKYVKIQRLCLDILNDVAKTNGVYSEEKFKKLVLTGKIQVNGLVFPKLQGRARKTINWDYIATEYIEDRSKNPDELIRDDDVQELEEETLESSIDRYFGSQEELDRIMEDFTEEEKIKNSRAVIDPKSDPYFVPFGNKKTRKNLVKSTSILTEIKNRERLDRKNRRARSYSTDLQDEDIEFIEKYDRKRLGKKLTKDGIPEFKGDMTNPNDVEQYLYEMDEYERENTFYDYHGRRMNIYDINEMELRSEMERNNWNLRNLYYDKEREKKLKKARKKDKKKEKELKKMLMEIQKRKEGRKEAVGGMGINTKKKKGMSKKKKKKTKKKHKKELEYFDDVLLDINGSTKETFEEYRKEMESFQWKKK